MISYLKKIDINLPTSLIPTGIDLERFNQKLSSEEKNKLISELNLNGNSKILVYIGRIEKEKKY